MSLDALKAGVLALVVIAVLAAAAAIGIDAFQEDLGDQACTNSTHWYNATSRVCCENATESGCLDTHGGSAAFNATDEGLAGTANASSYLSTIGTLIGVAALIAVVVGAFYMAQQ